MGIDSLEAYIHANKHLPNLPSAKEVQAAGNTVAVGQMSNQLLEKIEELTLYIISLKKENDAIKQQLQALLDK